MDAAAAVPPRAIDLGTEHPFRVGCASIDPASRDAAVNGTVERLQPQNLKVLVALAGNRGKVVTRDELVDLCWEGRFVGDDVINRAISTLRQFAERAGGFTIETVPRAGYRLVEATPRKKQSWRRWAPVAAVAALAAVLVIWFMGGRAGNPAPERTPIIALLPFTQASSDAELRELGSRARDSLAHTFSQSGVPVRLLNSLPQAGRPDFVISGELSKNADKVVAMVRLDEVAHGATVFSHRFEAAGEDVHDLPERIGAQMAGNLAWSSPMMMLDRRHPIDPPLLSDLLLGTDFAGEIFGLQAYQNAKRVAAKAPNLQAAQIGVAFHTSFVLDQIPRDERPEAVAVARRAADRAIELGPNFGDTYGTWCLLHSEALWTECEDRLRAGRRIDPDAPFLNTFLSHLLRNVGRFNESADLARLAYTHDVYVPTKIAWMLKTLEYSGEGDAARELYQRGARWWPEYKPLFFLNRLFGQVERADFNAMRRLELEVGPKDLPGDYTGSNALVAALTAKSVAGAKQACSHTDAFLFSIRCMLTLSILGDQDGAYAIADKLYPRRVGRTPVETERIWIDNPGGAGALELLTSPGAAPMRGDRRFLELAKRTGLLAYWRGGRLPDFCQPPQPEPICAQFHRH